MSKEAMKLALEALKEASELIGPAWAWRDEKGKPAITALREALNASLAEQPAHDQRPFCYHDGRNIVGKEFAHHSDVFPLYTAPQPEQQDWEAIAADQAMTIAMLKSEQPAQQNPVACVQDLDEVKRKQLVYEKGMDWKDPLYTSPPARKPLGFAGVTAWVGDAVATQIVTKVAIQCERIPSQSITMAAQRCVEMLAAHGIKGDA